MIWLLNQSGHELDFVRKRKAYEPIPHKPFGWDDVTATAPSVSNLLGYDNLFNNETIVVQSCTGTKETTRIATCTDPVLEQEPAEPTFLNIVTCTSLANQRCKIFECMEMKNYQDVKGDLYDFVPSLPGRRRNQKLNSLHR